VLLGVTFPASPSPRAASQGSRRSPEVSGSRPGRCRPGCRSPGSGNRCGTGPFAGASIFEDRKQLVSELGHEPCDSSQLVHGQVKSPDNIRHGLDRASDGVGKRIDTLTTSWLEARFPLAASCAWAPVLPVHLFGVVHQSGRRMRRVPPRSRDRPCAESQTWPRAELAPGWRPLLAEATGHLTFARRLSARFDRRAKSVGDSRLSAWGNLLIKSLRSRSAGEPERAVARHAAA
jgi:hypothetical protein